MPAPSEFQIQRAVVIWAEGIFRKTEQRWSPEPALLPTVVMWHTPNNGRRGQDGALEGKFLKEMGVKPGIPDLFFLHGGLFGLELKKADGSLSKDQRNLHPRLVAAGARVATAYSLDEAKQIVRGWGLTIHGR